MRLWDVYSGKEIFKWSFKTSVRCVAWNEGNNQVLCITDATMGQKSTIHIFDVTSDLSKCMLDDGGGATRGRGVG